MKSILSLAVAVTALVVGAECRNKTTVFAPSLMPNIDRHDLSHIYPSPNVSLHYTSNRSVVRNTNINVTHTMKYPAVLLEQSESEQSFSSHAITRNLPSNSNIQTPNQELLKSFPLQAVLSNANLLRSCFRL